MSERNRVLVELKQQDGKEHRAGLISYKAKGVSNGVGCTVRYGGMGRHITHGMATRSQRRETDTYSRDRCKSCKSSSLLSFSM